MRYLLALVSLVALTANAQQSTLGRLSSGAAGTNTTILYPELGDISLIIGTNPPVGKRYFLEPGVYYCSNWFKCPTNGAVTGCGAGATTLIDMFTNGIPTALIAPSDYGYVSDLSVSNYYFDTAAGVPAACIGAHQNNCVAAGGVVTAGSGGYTNFLVERCILYGGSDTFYNRHTNSSQAVVRNCVLYGTWDIVALFGTGTNKIDFEHCDFIHIPVADHGAVAYDLEVIAANATALVRNYYCTFYSSNGIAGKVSQLWSSQDPFANAVQAVEFHFCTATNAKPNQLGAPFIHLGDTSQPLLIEGGLGYVTPTTIGVDDVTTIRHVRYSPVVSTNFTFGGDPNNGLGPQLTTAFPTAKTIVSDSTLDLGGNSVTNVARFSAKTNLCSQPAAGFTPNFNLQNETANTNNGGAIVFAAGTLPATYAGDMVYHEVLIHKTAAGDQPVIFPAPYVTNINLTSLGGVYRCTNNSLVQIRIWPGVLTNVWCFPIN